MPLVYFKRRKYLNVTGTILSEAKVWIKRYPSFNEYELREGIQNISGGTEDVNPNSVHLTLWHNRHSLGIKYGGGKVWHRDNS
jgi:hypothetical protein